MSSNLICICLRPGFSYSQKCPKLGYYSAFMYAEFSYELLWFAGIPSPPRSPAN